MHTFDLDRVTRETSCNRPCPQRRADRRVGPDQCDGTQRGPEDGQGHLRATPLDGPRQHLSGGGRYHYPHAPTTAPEPKKPFLEKWQTWLALAIAVLTVVTMVLELPSKIGVLFPEGTTPENKVLEQTLAGSVRDELGTPLAEVQVALPELGLITTTDQLGHAGHGQRGRDPHSTAFIGYSPSAGRCLRYPF